MLIRNLSPARRPRTHDRAAIPFRFVITPSRFFPGLLSFRLFLYGSSFAFITGQQMVVNENAGAPGGT